LPFPLWADFFCGHDGADAINKFIIDLRARFQHGSLLLYHFTGEGGILFIGITSDGSPLFLDHITHLGSVTRGPELSVVALVGLQIQ
jgi:hypothetical protein